MRKGATPEPLTASEFGKPASSRLDAVDWLRGVVIVIMALDHSRGYFFNNQFDPTDLAKTNTALYLTRWLTHFCAPTFVFLAGTGAFLSRIRGKGRGELAWFLLSRGLWLVLLEVTVIRFGQTFSFEYKGVGLAVIWAIGWSMVGLAGLVFLPTAAVATLGVAILALHNAFDDVKAADCGGLGWLWSILHSSEAVKVADNLTLYPAYALLPWLGVMAAGYGLGAMYLLEPGPRRRQLWGMGLALVAVFVVLRHSNRYGDPQPWKEQVDTLFTVFSFCNCHKYPPSLLFLLMTLGPALIALALFDRAPGRIGRFFVTFGRVPLFFYVFHWYVIHLTTVGLAYLRYGSAIWEMRATGKVPEDYGFSLPVVYLLWGGVVLIMYVLCHWFAGVKQRNRAWWLSYL